MQDRRSAEAAGARREPRRQRGGLLQPLSEAFLYRSPHEPLDYACRLDSAARKEGGYDDV